MEAIYEFDVNDMPVTVAVDASGKSVHETGPADVARDRSGIPVKRLHDVRYSSCSSADCARARCAEFVVMGRACTSIAHFGDALGVVSIHKNCVCAADRGNRCRTRSAPITSAICSKCRCCFIYSARVALDHQITTMFLLACAWGFVALRAAHAYIHLTHNMVIRRFRSFVASTLVCCT